MKLSVGTILASLLVVAVAAPREHRSGPEGLDIRDHPDVDARAVEDRSAAEGNLGKRDYAATANHGSPLKCLEGPYKSSGLVTQFGQGETIFIKCQTRGQTIDGNPVWNRINRNWASDCWVPDRFTKTSVDGFIPGVPRC